MDDEKKAFHRKKNSVSFVLIRVILLVSLASLAISSFLSHKGHSSIYFIIILIFTLILAVVNISEIYMLVTNKKKEAPNLSVSDKQIVLHDAVGRSKTILIEDIKDLYIPKWDEYIQIICKDDNKSYITLAGYKDEEKNEIRKIFKSIHNKLNGCSEEDINESNRTHYVVKGNSYIK